MQDEISARKIEIGSPRRKRTIDRSVVPILGSANSARDGFVAGATASCSQCWVIGLRHWGFAAVVIGWVTLEVRWRACVIRANPETFP